MKRSKKWRKAAYRNLLQPIQGSPIRLPRMLPVRLLLLPQAAEKLTTNTSSLGSELSIDRIAGDNPQAVPLQHSCLVRGCLGGSNRYGKTSVRALYGCKTDFETVKVV